MVTLTTQGIPSLSVPQSGSSVSEKSKNSRPSPFTRQISEWSRAVAITCLHPGRTFRSYRKERETTKKPPEKELPFTLSFWGLLLLLVFELLILIAITVLWVLTTRRNGFTDVPDTPASFTGSRSLRERLLWALSLFWTFIPSLIVSMCGAFFAATLLALEDCQPTIELRKVANSENLPGSNEASRAGSHFPFSREASSHPLQETSKAKLSVLLDYRRDWFPFADSIHAFRNKHFLISACTIARWFLVATGPLASAIISVGSVPSSKSVQVTTSRFLSDNTDYTWWSSTRPSFDSASAILLNDASTLSWSTRMYSVLPFSASSETASGNLTADTSTYSATLDCVSIDVDSLLSAGNVTKDYQNMTTFNFVDRGCAAQAWINPDASWPLYSRTRYLNCPYEANRTRLLLLTGMYDSDSSYLLGNFSFISCIPDFWKSTSRVAALSGANAPGQSGQIVDIVPDISSFERWWPKFWQAWMLRIPQYEVADPQHLIDADNFGYMAYSYANKPNAPIDLVQAMNVTFSALFATFTTLTLFVPLAENVTFTGTLSRPGNRLFVVSLPAILVTFVMAFSFVVTVWIAVYAQKHKVILKEHVDLILGHAILLEGNEGVGGFVNTVREDFQRQARVAFTAAVAKKAEQPGVSPSALAINLVGENAAKNGDFVKYAEDFGDFKNWDCWVDSNGKIRMREPASTSNSA